jgi:iron complex outermembrane receptor protein
LHRAIDRDRQDRHVVLAGMQFEVCAQARQGVEPPLDTQNPDYSIPVTAPSLIITDRVETIGQVGLYAQNQSKIADHWVLSVGGRQAWIDHTNFDRLGDAGSYDQKDHASPAMSASAISSTMA